MAPKIFLTGATGYIGGTVLDTLVTAHPEYAITVLLRNIPPTFTTKHPQISIIHGDYDSTSILSHAASQADIVIHCGNSDHEPSIKALIAGLISGGRASSPGYLIHLSGTGIVADWQDPTYRGKLNPKVWSDVVDIDAIMSLPDEALHRNVDKLIQTAAAEHGERLRTAIVCPPDIYGPGRGLGRIQSVYFPTMVAESRNVGATFYAGDGGNTRSWVHIEDLMGVYVGLVEKAVEGGGGADWGLEGYYFASTSEASQLELATAAGKILHAHGVLPTPEPKKLPDEQVGAMLSSYGRKDLGYYMFASNSRTRADRAGRVLGYGVEGKKERKGRGIWEAMERDLLASLE